ncbi:hypothetical protein GCM10022255_117430 [Dactylosporangium darangshiense]|uniref:Uncharacterized protein n=1 Tax=Dactylosporangium darangshiense TaxID=579108 RepID=A0ABP8DWJ2_9ACTN
MTRTGQSSDGSLALSAATIGTQHPPDTPALHSAVRPRLQSCLLICGSTLLARQSGCGAGQSCLSHGVRVAQVPTLKRVDPTIAAAYVAAGAAIATSITSVIATRSAASKGAQAALNSAERTAKATLEGLLR